MSEASELRDASASVVPIAPAGIEAMDRNLALLADALLKGFESLVNQLQDQVWSRAAAFEGEDPLRLSRRDVMELTEKLRLWTRPVRFAASRCSATGSRTPARSTPPGSQTG